MTYQKECYFLWFSLSISYQNEHLFFITLFIVISLNFELRFENYLFVKMNTKFYLRLLLYLIWKFNWGTKIICFDIEGISASVFSAGHCYVSFKVNSRYGYYKLLSEWSGQHYSLFRSSLLHIFEVFQNNLFPPAMSTSQKAAHKLMNMTPTTMSLDDDVNSLGGGH